MYYNKLMPRSRSRSRSSRKKSVQRRKFGSVDDDTKKVNDFKLVQPSDTPEDEYKKLLGDAYKAAIKIKTNVETDVKTKTDKVNNIKPETESWGDIMFRPKTVKEREEAAKTLMDAKTKAMEAAAPSVKLYKQILDIQIQYLKSINPEDKQIKKLQGKLAKFKHDNFDILNPEYSTDVRKARTAFEKIDREQQSTKDAAYDAELRESISGAYEPVREAAAKNIDERTKAYLRPLARWLEKQIEENPRYFVSIPITSFAIVVSILGLRVFWRRIKSALQKAKDDYNVVQQFRKGKLELIDKSAPFKVKDRDLSREEKDEWIVENYKKGNLKETQKSSSRRRTQKSSSRK